MAPITQYHVADDLFYDVFSHVTYLVGDVPELSMNNFDAFCFFLFFNLNGGCNNFRQKNFKKTQIWLKISEVLKAR